VKNCENWKWKWKGWKMRFCFNKVGCVFAMVIWSEFSMGQYRDKYHREDASHFIRMDRKSDIEFWSTFFVEEPLFWSPQKPPFWIIPKKWWRHHDDFIKIMTSTTRTIQTGRKWYWSSLIGLFVGKFYGYRAGA